METGGRKQGRKTPKRAQRRAQAGARFLADVLAANLRALRSLRGLTQAQLADRMGFCGHPWTQSTVSDVESGERTVSVDELLGLAISLGTSPPDLIDPAGIDGRARQDLDLGTLGTAPVEFAGAWLRGSDRAALLVLEQDEGGDYTLAAPWAPEQVAAVAQVLRPLGHRPKREEGGPP